MDYSVPVAVPCRPWTFLGSWCVGNVRFACRCYSQIHLQLQLQLSLLVRVYLKNVNISSCHPRVTQDLLKVGSLWWGGNSPLDFADQSTRNNMASPGVCCSVQILGPLFPSLMALSCSITCFHHLLQNVERHLLMSGMYGRPPSRKLGRVSECTNVPDGFMWYNWGPFLKRLHQRPTDGSWFCIPFFNSVCSFEMHS